jgi:hypothetical protein
VATRTISLTQSMYSVSTFFSQLRADGRLTHNALIAKIS